AHTVDASHGTPSVTDANEIEALGRRGQPGLAAGPTFEQALDLSRVLLDHRPDERANHVPEEAVRSDLELEAAAAPVPRRRLDRSYEHPVLGLCRCESTKVVLPAQQVG